MKRLIAFLLALCALLTLTACGEQNHTHQAQNANPTCREDTADFIIEITRATEETVPESTQVTEPTVTEPAPEAPAETTPADTTPAKPTTTSKPASTTTASKQESSQQTTVTPPAPVTGHTHSYTKKVTEVSCKNDGYTTYTCQCGDSYIGDPVRSMGHVIYGEFTVLKQPTATETGLGERRCIYCNELQDERVLGRVIEGHTSHDFERVEAIEATCRQEGLITHTCFCGEYYRDTVPKISHRVNFRTVRATCVKGEYEIRTCINCDFSYQTEPGEPDLTTHIYETGEIPPTCTEEGYTVYTCTRCGDSYSEPIRAHGHYWPEMVCNSDIHCTECGEFLYHFTHSFSGSYNRICTVCRIGWCELHGHCYGDEIQCQSFHCGYYDPEIVAIINNIFDRIFTENMSEYEKVKAIHDYMVLNTRYDMENYLNKTVPDVCYTARGVLENGVAVCGGYAKAFQVLCRFAGLECEYTRGRALGGNHAWNQVQIDGKWYNIDVTWDDPDNDDPKTDEYYIKPHIRYQFFLLSNEEFYKSHVATVPIHDCDTTYRA